MRPGRLGRLGRLGRRLGAAALLVLVLVGGAALALRWGLLCTSAPVWQKVNRVCIEHMSGEATGNICQALCVMDDVQAITCHPSARSSDTAFTAYWNNKRLIFKSPRKTTVFDPDALYWVDEKNQRHYPSNEEFRNMIKELVLLKVNMTISDKKAQELSKLPREDANHIDQDDASQHAMEMDNVWMLLQDYDYLLTILFSSTGIFPKRVGTCGSLYATEHAEPLKSASALFSLEETNEEWERRCRVAVLILELLDKFDKANLRLCDVELSHFGASGGKLKYLNVNGVKAKGMACYPGERGNRDNLQAVCEKVYLGWVVRAKVVLPGLLVSRRAPSALTTILRRCADPDAPAPPKELRRALHNTLVKRH